MGIKQTKNPPQSKCLLATPEAVVPVPGLRTRDHCQGSLQVLYSPPGHLLPRGLTPSCHKPLFGSQLYVCVLLAKHSAHCVTFNLQSSPVRSVISSILLMRKLRLREVKQLAPGPTPSRWPCQSSPGQSSFLCFRPPHGARCQRTPGPLPLWCQHNQG